MLRPNLGLLVCRQSKEPFAVLATRHLTTHKIVAVYDRTSLAPLWLYPDLQGSRPSLRGEHERVPNFRPGIVKALVRLFGPAHGEAHVAADLSPEDLFHYLYAVFHSPNYRARYAEFLKTEFPRLPVTGHPALFRALASLGEKLVALHVLEAPACDLPIAKYVGSRAPVVEKISWSRNTVWLDKGRANGFEGVREQVWDYHVGGYQVCEKWLKDRKDRRLSKDEIAHYQKIIVALSETILLMKEVDEVIERHGGWPGAFKAGTQEATGKEQQLRVAEPRATFGAAKGRDQRRR
jgi:predicted helicase